MFEDDFPTAEEHKARVARWEAERAKERVVRRHQEQFWRGRYPDEWVEWVRLQPLLNPLFAFGAGKPFDFDDFLTEVGRSPSPRHRVSRRDKGLPYQQGNLRWRARRIKPYPSPYLNLKQAAAYCQVAKQTIYNNRRFIERLPGISKLLFTRESLDKWLATRPPKKRKK